MDRSSETTTIKLLDAWKTKKGMPSDNQAAIALGISRTAVSKWRKGEQHASAAFAAQMAKDLGLDELSVLAAIEADRARDGNDRRVWQRHGRSAFMALLVGLSLGLPQARAAGDLQRLGSSPSQMSQNHPLCEVPRWTRRRRGRQPWNALKAA